MAKKKTNDEPSQQPGFEDALKRLEEIVHSLEEGDLGLNEALARFEQIDRLKADLVKLRYFAGLTIPQAA